jgi:thiamine monophosphate synthase
MLARDQIQQHIDELDAQIPKEDAKLLISYDVDSASDCEIIGNHIGYLRFGIEMLKAVVVELEPGQSSQIFR